jgi:hypothetical protein
MKFVSKHNFGLTDVANRVRSIQWFSKCGEELFLDLSMPIIAVGSWSEAMAHCAAETWENVELEAQNDLTAWLHANDLANYRKWNQIVRDHKSELLDKLTSDVWIPAQQKHQLDRVFVSSVQWDILGALMENSYLPSAHRCFFLELLMVYEAGHYPCGWAGDWPHGELIIF